MEICRLEHVRKIYHMGEQVVPLQDICLNVNAGDFIAVEGVSGAGKSTLLAVMGTLLSIDGGRYFFEGKDVSSLSDRQKTDLRAKKIGFLFQDTNLIQALTVRENLLFAQTLGGVEKADGAAADTLLEQLGLTERASFLPHQLSGGQRRRAMAARCLIHTPHLILADEPTNDLDEAWAGRIVALLAGAAKRGTGVVMVSHNSRWTAGADARYRLDGGVLTKLGKGGE